MMTLFRLLLHTTIQIIRAGMMIAIKTPPITPPTVGPMLLPAGVTEGVCTPGDAVEEYTCSAITTYLMPVFSSR